MAVALGGSVPAISGGGGLITFTETDALAPPKSAGSVTVTVALPAPTGQTETTAESVSGVTLAPDGFCVLITDWSEEVTISPIRSGWGGSSFSAMSVALLARIDPEGPDAASVGSGRR